ncbi:MAG TPA: helix-turn-helix transcriptional regulator [Microbacteriaceae bacterium]
MESSEFAHSLRRWRDRIAPESVGLSFGGRRRAAGLRREELAALASISVDYLTRLEQGRATSPSAQVVEALARALRLSDSERELLFRLAGQAAPGRDLVSSRITASVQRLLDRLSGNPVAVYDAMWNLVVANAPYDALMGETTAWRGIHRNAVWRNLVGAATRVVHTQEDHAQLVAGLIADLRMTAARYPADPRVQRLAAELRTADPRFGEYWEGGALEQHGDQSRHKVIDHPSAGRIAVDCDTLVVAGDDIRLMVYSAEPASPDAERLALAIVLGTQSLV